MSHGRTLCICLAFLTLGRGGEVSAQEPTVIEGLSIADTLVTLVSPNGSFAVGDALRAAAVLEIATTPLGNASPGFTFVFDSELGLDVRRTDTFGAAFAERASTLGSGMFAAGANVLVASYDKVGDTSLDSLRLSDIETANPFLPKSANASLVLSSTTMALFGSMGLTDRLDVGVAVPFVEVGVEGVSWVESNDPDEDFRLLAHSMGGASGAGLGDIELSAKYRVQDFGDPDDPREAGGVAVGVRARVPTGSQAGLRGLGVTRVSGSVIASGAFGTVRPHGSVGYEWWSDGVEVMADATGRSTLTVEHQLHYAAGVEYAPTERVTLLFDFLGRHMGDAGVVGSTPLSSPTGQSLGVLAEGIRKLTFAPGVKWNATGSMLLSLQALVALDDNGLHDQFLPVVGLDWTF